MKKYLIFLSLILILVFIKYKDLQHRKMIDSLSYKKIEYDAGYMNFLYYSLKFSASFEELMIEMEDYEKINILSDSLKLAAIINLYEEKLFEDLKEGLGDEIFKCRVKVSNKKDIVLEKSISSVYMIRPLNFTVIKQYVRGTGTSNLVKDTSYYIGNLITIQLDSISEIDGIQILQQIEITNELYIEVEYIASLEIPKEKLKNIFML